MVKRLLVVLVAACGGSAAPADAPSGDAPLGKLMFTGQATILTGDCRPYVVTGAPAEIDLTGLGEGHAYANAADCAIGANPMSTLAVSTFFFRDETAEMLTLTATVPGASGSVDVQTVALGVLGQVDATSHAQLAAAVSPLAISVGGGKLVVGSIAPSRVLIWSTLPTSSATPPDLVLGQPDLQTDAPRATSNRVSGSATAIWTDGTRLLIAEGYDNRILGWRTFPTTNDQPADFVLGQTSFTGNAAGAASATSLAMPSGIASDGTRLFVADSGHERVLVWNAFPTTTAAPASFALGEPDLVTTSSGCSATLLGAPAGLAYAGGTLYVGDPGNFRIVGFPTIAANAPATFALGQPDLATCDQSAPPSATTVSRAIQLASDGTRLYAADAARSRVMVWSSLPSTNNAPANLALGQLDLVSSGDDGDNGLFFSQCVASDGTRVFACDSAGRVVGYATIPTASGAAPDFALGQPNLAHRGPDDLPVTAATFAAPSSFYTDGQRVFVADTDRSRVLVWLSIPKTPAQAPDFALGQPDLTSAAPNRGGVASSKTLAGPSSVTSDGTRLYVADAGNNRVLIWNALPISSVGADVVVGQPDMATTQLLTPSTVGSLAGPGRVVVHAGKLYVADTRVGRVQVWNAIPTANGATADLSLTGMQMPSGIAFPGAGLAVSDAEANRVLIWPTLPTSATAATIVLGQPDLTSTSPGFGGLSASSLTFPSSVASDGTRLIVTDSANNRVLIWDALPTANDAAANHVLGQADATSSFPNGGARLGPTTVANPGDVTAFAGHLFVSDTGNDRIVSF